MYIVPYLTIILIVCISFYLTKYVEKHQCPKCGSFHTNKGYDYLHCHKCNTSTKIR